MDITQPQPGRADALDAAAREAVYRTILSRRDVRGEFLPDPVSQAQLSRILLMAHHAPSVGFMQPWDFILIRDRSVKEQVHALFDRANAEAAMMFEDSKQATYRALKLEGILESPINICVTCDRERAGPVVIGRTHIPFMDLFSSVCAVQNLWLAARAEGLGLGWVSILDNAALRKLLGIPAHIVPVAYLCIGHVKGFHERPELEKCGWRQRLPIGDLIHFDRWQGHHRNAPLLSRLQRDQDAIEDGTFLSSRLA
ncbi:cob(II)yrinic acid a,c-diamide reductase [Defluviimonas sp. 20V17]|uniref:Cob(II)yrinic acid a,c-diamide reductase n=1 Tax=Allgaiera indica TaxID=765699 RepID=A0AAN4UT10_9RHOB|nr:5,6-dimethylbenzimidazole synthase [Allgaiera indica]KDB01659.1 cob(II)yrinic acid a,c-diamide reductase [Defluviimonas sp. 20V17]GHE03920.1 nitroreductase [Allgaiera indica]SDX35657.1 cob(II)yrinic acid a,c-diamide reductase [Allgaiera indica]